MFTNANMANKNHCADPVVALVCVNMERENADVYIATAVSFASMGNGKTNVLSATTLFATLRDARNMVTNFPAHGLWAIT